MPDEEMTHLEKLYTGLRERLLDMTLRNPMLSYKHRPSSKQQLQFVDEVLENVYGLLTEGANLEILHLPEADDLPQDERAEDFIAALEHAKVSDIEYLTKIQALESTGRDDEFEIAKAERILRDKVREELGLPPRPNRTTINPADHARSIGIDPSVELQPSALKDTHSDKKLQTLKWADNLESILERIADNARLAEQETGLSTLHLTFGFLEWCEKDGSKKLFAPLLLLPVRLNRSKVGRSKLIFTLSATTEAAEANLCLQKKVDRDFARRIPDLEIGEGEIGSIENYFERVSHAIEGLNGWRIRRWLTLGHFAFGRFAMYADLAPENWKENPVSHKLVGSIVRGTEMAGDGGSSLLEPPEDYTIDDPEIEKFAPILIHDADASQHSALVDVMKSKNLVIQGPPGTGKSQTITNVIANALADGKTILFLAEKQAALDVVKRRLVKAGIGDFCLELHSDRATPRLVIESLKQRKAQGFSKQGATLPAHDITWSESRREIGSYIESLHAPAEDGRALFDLIWRALRARTEIGAAMQELRAARLPNAVLDGGHDYETASGAISLYAKMAARYSESYGLPKDSPWNGLTFSNARRPNTTTLLEDLTEIKQSAERVNDILLQASDDFGISTLADLDTLIEIDRLVSSDVPEGSAIQRIAGLKPEDLESLIELQCKLSRLKDALAGRDWVDGFSEIEDDALNSLAKALGEASDRSLTPRLICEQSAERLATAEAVLDDLARITPAVEILGSPNDIPSNSIAAVKLAVMTAGLLTDETRRWFNWLEPQAASAFEMARAEWAERCEDEARWRGRFPNCRRAWPTPDELLTAAGIVAKGAVGRTIAAMTGGTKILSAITEHLNIMARVNIPAEDLRGLAQHVQALANFNSNRAYQQILGTDWQGIDTPFDKIVSVQKMRAVAMAKIAEGPHGDQIGECFARLTEDNLAALGRESDAVKAAITVISDARDWLDETSFSAKRTEIENTRNRAKTILSADPERHLQRFDVPITSLEEGVRLEKDRRRTEEQMQHHPLRHEVSILAGDTDAIAESKRALAWIRTILMQTSQGIVQDMLLSVKASTTRQKINAIAEKAAPALQELRTKLSEIEDMQGVSGFDSRTISGLLSQLAQLLPRRDELSEYLTLCDQRHELNSKDLGSFLEAAEARDIALTQLPSLFTGLVAQRRADKAKQNDPILVRASGQRIDALRSEFIARDKQKIEMDRKRVRDHLVIRRPPAGRRDGSRKTWTDMELLNNEFGKEKGFVPVRDLMRRAGDAILAMTPCFMMSPLSLAKFLPAGRIKFDILIVDEASQMRPEDALGGLLRVHQLVVVGDQKQLPPTDFFARSGDGSTSIADDDGFDSLDDESILEACQKTFRETRLLRWHYRSRCESLINFSNREFYRGELITFPMAKPGSFSIDLIRVNGHYEARRNLAEAQTIAEEAIQFMRHHADEPLDQTPTIGIVAVNSDQRDLIFEEIRRLEAGDSRVEDYRRKVAERGEPVFVKNLENVQGDERDFILISMTYGPQPGANVVLQRFGPINGKHGHRRLNVLFSRARIRIGLFTSFGSADIQPQESSAQGVHVLKRYLEYAESRGRECGEVLGAPPDSDFEVEVADRLRARGYEVDYQVGVSGFRIDLGIRHPNHPERYLAGVECDGASYHSSKSARDRDRLREEVLTGLGWNLVRVWSTDWFDNADIQTERLVKRLEELRTIPVDQHNGFNFIAGVRDLEPFGNAPTSTVEDIPAELDIIAEPSDAAAEDTVTSAPDASSPIMEPPPLPAAPHLAEGILLTEKELGAALREFRDSVIAVEMQPWESHRSILRESMIETIIAQRLDDPDHWFNRIPAFQRQATNPAERKRYIDRICDLVARLQSRPLENAARTSSFAKAISDAMTEDSRQSPTFDTPRPAMETNPYPASSLQSGNGSRIYVIADVAASGVTPDPARFSEHSYRPMLARMISHVVATEGPIYADQLVTRIARSHGFQRNGAFIVDTVMSATDRRLPRTMDDGRELIWPMGSTPHQIHPFRGSIDDARDHNDIPLIELASLAEPHISLRTASEEDILEKMKDHFSLSRLREATRQRFLSAIALARTTEGRTIV